MATSEGTTSLSRSSSVCGLPEDFSVGDAFAISKNYHRIAYLSSVLSRWVFGNGSSNGKVSSATEAGKEAANLRIRAKIDTVRRRTPDSRRTFFGY